MCFIITKEHKIYVEGLDNIEDVDEFDYTANYPQKITFEYPFEGIE